MNLKSNCFFCLLLVGTLWTYGQNRKIKLADKSFARYDFSQAAELYEKAIAQGYEKPKAYQNLADSHYYNADYDKAASWFGKLAEKDESVFDIEHMHRFALALKSVGNYTESNRWMEKLIAAKSDDIRGKAYAKNRDYIKRINKRSDRFDINNMVINSPESEFAPSFMLEALVFSSSRDSSLGSSQIHAWNKKRFLNLYTASPIDEANFGSIQKFSDKLNTRAHESSTAFTADGKTVYFTRNNTKNNNFARDEKGISRLKLYKATFENGQWGNVKELPFNSEDYSVAHPSLNQAGDKLYFSSDMPGTFGQSDIFVVAIHSDGTYGTPTNVGPKINTEGKETFPYVTKENVLYFSSDGHPGLGGLDVFATRLEKDPYVVNVGEPVNSSADDFSFIINSETKKGYFASNRKGGKGGDDIYAILETKSLDMDCGSEISGVVRDKETQETVAGALVILYDDSNTILEETTSGADGTFVLQSDCGAGQYAVIATKEKYDKETLAVDNREEESVAAVDFWLVPMKEGVAIGTSLTNFLNIDLVYFDLNKAYIREDARTILDQIVSYLLENDQVKIQIRSHTDSRSSDAYNNRLSDRRAKATLAYLLSKGIGSERMSGMGYGESQLTNDCDNTKKCSEAEHQKNRRSEFVVVE